MKKILTNPQSTLLYTLDFIPRIPNKQNLRTGQGNIHSPYIAQKSSSSTNQQHEHMKRLRYSIRDSEKHLRYLLPLYLYSLVRGTVKILFVTQLLVVENKVQWWTLFLFCLRPDPQPSMNKTGIQMKGKVNLTYSFLLVLLWSQCQI